MLELPSVTLACIDTNHPEAGAEAMRRSMRLCNFGSAMMVCPERPANLPANVAHHYVPPFPHMRCYSNFVLHELHKLIHTPHCLVVQSDGFVRNPDAWTDEFLDYDYIGSPWPAWDKTTNSWSGKAGWMTGNGGFSLRSKRFLVEASKLGFVLNEPVPGEKCVPAEECEDWFCCVTRRDQLEKAGIRFAPPELAGRFSFEHPRPLPCPWPDDRRKVFGFHGDQAWWHLNNLYDLDVMEERKVKKCILIIGPVRSGLGLVSRCVAACGVPTFEGSLAGAPDSIYWTKSLPTDIEWPDLDEMVAELRRRKYDINVLCVTRNMYACARSQHKHTGISIEDAGHNISEAIRRMGTLVRKQHAWGVWSSLETVTRDWHLFRQQLTEMGLNCPTSPPEPLYDANAKYRTAA